MVHYDVLGLGMLIVRLRIAVRIQVPRIKLRFKEADQLRL